MQTPSKITENLQMMREGRIAEAKIETKKEIERIDIPLWQVGLSSIIFVIAGYFLFEKEVLKR